MLSDSPAMEAVCIKNRRFIHAYSFTPPSGTCTTLTLALNSYIHCLMIIYLFLYTCFIFMRSFLHVYTAVYAPYGYIFILLSSAFTYVVSHIIFFVTNPFTQLIHYSSTDPFMFVYHLLFVSGQIFIM